ncbi:hypothetical protein [Streptomyces sp. Ncost-T10-10d]|uniref:hypothetical protein n=1 Tax=Streptomyces sp. Ncost-T10-10d TaxID=1839774 RepID=UPI00081D50B4|nr:hypothetical protein [Streptomyces sp. Ncost-T10-10d]SCF96381.1 hypothetical protein GA0115254_128133 [Streptomyces sp. Ncost-T10-10d]
MLPDGRTTPGLSLVKGRHLRPGARYEPSGSDTEELATTVVREWRRSCVVALEQLVRSPQFTGRSVLRLYSPERPGAQWNETPGRILGQDLDELRAGPADHAVGDPDDEAG